MLINWFTVLAQIVNFLILIYLLKRFLYGPIIRAMQERERKIAAAMEQAGNAREEAEKRAVELEEEKQALQEAREGLLAEAKEQVREWRERTLRDSRREVEKLRQAWMDRLNQDKQVFLEKLKHQVAGQVMRISDEALQDLADEDLEWQVLEVFLGKLEQEKDQFPVEGLSGPLLVRSGFQLDDKASDKLQQRLLQWFPGAEPLRFEVIKEVGFGVEVKAGDRKVAWNLTDYLKDLEKEILTDLFGTGQEKL